MSNIMKNNGGSPDSGFRLDRDNGKVFGVCAGLANTTGVDALWIRLGLVITTLALTGLTIPVYIIAALVAD